RLVIRADRRFRRLGKMRRLESMVNLSKRGVKKDVGKLCRTRSGEGPFVPNVHISTDVNRFEPMGSESGGNQTASMPFAGGTSERAVGRWGMPSVCGAGPRCGPVSEPGHWIDRRSPTS